MLRLEFRVVHAMLVVSDVVGAFACLLATCRVSPESLADGRQPAGIQFLVPLLGPLAGSFRMVRIEGLGDVTQVLLDMEAVDDFDGSREQFLGWVPDLGGAAADDVLPWCLLEAPAGGSPPDSCGKLGAVSVGVGRGGTFDGGRVTHRALIAHRVSFGVARLGAPNGAQLDLPGFSPSHRFACPHGPPTRKLAWGLPCHRRRGTGSREGRRRGRVPYAAARRGRSWLPAPRRFAPLAWPAPRPRPIRGAVGCPLRSSLEQRPWPPCGGRRGCTRYRANPASGPADRSLAGNPRNDNRRVPAAADPECFARFWRGGPRNEPLGHRCTPAAAPHSQTDPRSTAARKPAPPAAVLDGERPFPVPPDPVPPLPSGLKAPRPPGRSRPGASWGAPFFGPLGGPLADRQFGVRPLLAGLPVDLHLLPKLSARFDLAAHRRQLFLAHIARASLSPHRLGQGVIGAVAGLGGLVARTMGS